MINVFGIQIYLGERGHDDSRRRRPQLVVVRGTMSAGQKERHVGHHRAVVKTTGLDTLDATTSGTRAHLMMTMMLLYQLDCLIIQISTKDFDHCVKYTVS
jgi:hypothetical protein